MLGSNLVLDFNLGVSKILFRSQIESVLSIGYGFGKKFEFQTTVAHEKNECVSCDLIRVKRNYGT
jgi:hypothetical protein